MNRRITAVGLLALAAAAALGLAIAARPPRGRPFGFERDWLALMVRSRTDWLTNVALFFNWLGSGRVAIYVIPVLIAALLLCFRATTDRALLFLLSVAGSGALVQLLKSSIARARPPEMLVPSDFGSYPSGHVANVATIAAVFLLFAVPRRRWLVPTAVVGALLVLVMAWSRTYLAVHWVLDTAGATLIGIGVPLVLLGMPVFASLRPGASSPPDIDR